MWAFWAQGVTQAWLPSSPEDTRILPALGGTWADQLLMRLMMDRRRAGEGPRAAPDRSLRVLFAPHLPPATCGYDVLTEGVRGTHGSESCSGDGSPRPAAPPLGSTPTRPRPEPPLH